MSNPAVVDASNVLKVQPEDLDDAPSQDEVLDPSSPEVQALYDEGKFDPKHYTQPLPWYLQAFTVRSFLTAVILLFVLNYISFKLQLAYGTGIAISVPAGLLTFVFIKFFTQVSDKIGLFTQPFTIQENTVVQTTIVSGMFMSGFFCGPLQALTYQQYVNYGPSKGNLAADTVNINLGMLFAIVPLFGFSSIAILLGCRRYFIIDSNLPWPSGSAAGVLINSLHSKVNIANRASKYGLSAVRVMGEWFAASFLWAMFRWFFSGQNGSCGFQKIPFFGLAAAKASWYWTTNVSYIGAGMITPDNVSLSMLLGAIISYGIMLPIVNKQAGVWFPLKNLTTTSFSGPYGYKALFSLALLIGESAYTLGRVGIMGIKEYKKWNKLRKEGLLNSVHNDLDTRTDDEKKYAVGNVIKEEPLERRLRRYYFFKDNIPGWWGMAAFVVIAIIGTAIFPHIPGFEAVKWYYVAPMWVVTPPLALACAYIAGMTDQNISNRYGEIITLGYAAALGPKHHGVIVGLILCVMVKTTSFSSVELLQDFKTGYYTMTSVKGMVAGQLLGNLIACVTCPLTFWLIYATNDVGVLTGPYPAPLAPQYRGIAVLGYEGIHALPRWCLLISGLAFVLAFGLAAARDMVALKYKRFVPSPASMGVTAFLGPYIAIEYCIGGAVRYLWSLRDPVGATALFPAVATGMIVGEGLWGIPAAVLNIAGYQQPMCMQWIHSKAKNSAFPSGY